MVGKLPAGALSDLLGRRRMMLVGCLFFAGPPFLYPLVDSPGSLLALCFVHGAATAIFSPVAAALVADLSQRARARRLGWFAAGGDLGSAPGAGVLVARLSYGGAFDIIGAGMALAALGFLATVRDPRAG
ncbi:MAG TPA: MFS transporter [Candidatus Binatia bacterium]|nr:MFS transporter [Candidatus Binatia bacterium]